MRAVKIILRDRLSAEELENFWDEMAILRRLDHPNILKLFEVFEEGNRFLLVTEYCKGGDLFDDIMRRHRYSRFNEQLAASYI